MPGYILHLTEATLILKELEAADYFMDEVQKNQFYLGCLLPDTRRGQNKAGSHFWNPEVLDHLALAPDLHRFEERFQDARWSSMLLGYWTHLHLDACYVNRYWPATIRFVDEEGKTRQVRSEIAAVEMKERGERVPVDDFFSSRWYYGDYSKLNAYFAEKYQLELPTYIPDDWKDFPVKEVETDQLQEVLQELASLFENRRFGEEKNLKVFCLDTLEKFIEDTAKEAAAEILRGVREANARKKAQKVRTGGTL